MSASYYIRRPFIVVGHKVTKENMAWVAQWCGGTVMTDKRRTFIKVPVERPTHDRQTEAWVGNHVVRSTFNERPTFKVYTEDWLQKEFIEIEKGDLGEADEYPTPTNRVIDNVRQLPSAREPRTNLHFKAHH